MVAERLRGALEVSRIPSIRELHRQIDDLVGCDVGYSTVARYFNGDIRPPLEFLESAAAVMEVRLAWILLGDPPVWPNGERPDEWVDVVVKEAGVQYLSHGNFNAAVRRAIDMALKGPVDG